MARRHTTGDAALPPSTDVVSALADTNTEVTPQGRRDFFLGYFSETSLAIACCRADSLVDASWRAASAPIIGE